MSSKLKEDIKECFLLKTDTILTNWIIKDCNSVLNTVINTTPSSYFTEENIISDYIYSLDSLEYSQSLFDELFSWYINNYTITDDETNPLYNSFQEKILNLCLNRETPGVCDNSLKTFCKNYSRDDVSTSEILTNLCGCYVPVDESYSKFTLGNIGCSLGNNNCSMCTQEGPDCVQQPSCDPFCNRAMTVRKANPITGDIISCPRGVCVIDNISINLENSIVPGGVNFNTKCSGCQRGSGGCYCIIGSTNVSNTMSEIGVGTNFNQLCGESSICVTFRPDGTKEERLCDDIISEENISGEKFKININWTLIFIFWFIIVVCVILYIFGRRS